nr:alpha-L-rhamnosidase C-terminal domain-containing protein [Isoptericola chiayiensis]
MCSDERLNQIWATSAYTLRLCLQELVVDGIKRDRMPWMGDQALSTLTNAFAFADRRAAHDTLVALGQPRHGYVNGIADYSLWWVIACGFYLRHFDATDDVDALAGQVERFLEDMAAHAGPDGILRPALLPDQFITHVFLDWGLEIDPDRDLTALQVLWWWAMTSGARVLTAARHGGAARWQGRADALRSVLEHRARDSAGTWRDYLDAEGPAATPYADFLAVASGLTENVPTSLRVAIRESGRAGTPFMTAFALRALGMAGERHEAVRRLRSWWGEMLDAGARTFWEDFADDGTDALDMYGRPFGKSLCHGWSAGPLVLLPELVLGVRPLADGWAVLELDPCLGDLTWARAVVPLPGGDLVVDAETSAAEVVVVVDVPPGSALRHPEHGELGPGRWTLTYPEESIT